MKKRPVAILLVVALALLVVLSGCSKGGDDSLARVKKAGVIRNGVNAEFMPFEYVDGDKIVGFDIDLADEIGKVLGVTVETHDFSFDGLIPALQARKVDMCLSALTITPDRAEKVDFSNPYFTATLVIVVREDEEGITDLNSLVGKKVGVQLGTTGDLVASEVEGVNVVQFQQLATPFIELKNGNVDAVIIDKPYAKLYTERNPGFKFAGPEFHSEDYGICVPKGDKELLDAINQALERIKSSGKYDELYRKWFDVPQG